MNNEAVVMTIDFGRDHFNAIVLNGQLKLILTDGTIINIRENANSGGFLKNNM